MNQRSDIDRVLQSWMADGPAVIPDRVVDVVTARIGVQRQRRAWPFVGRTNVTTQIKLIAALAAALVVAVVGYNVLPGTSGPGGPTAAPTPAPTLAPTPSPSEMVLSDGPLTAGRYRLQPYADAPNLSFTADIPGGWEGVLGVAMYGPRGFDGPQGVAIALLRADGLFRDPCHWDLDGSKSSDQPGDLARGPSADLSRALADNPSYESDGVASSGFPKTDGGIGEVAGREVTIRVPASVDIDACDKDSEGKGRYYVFSGPDAGFYAKGNGNIWDIHIVTVEDVRLIIVVSYFEDTPASDLAAAKAIVGSFDFVP
jgi:hypothetical protein